MSSGSDTLLSDTGIPIGYSIGERDPFSEGLYITNLTESQINEFATFLDDFYQKIRDSRKRKVTRTAATMLRGAVFALGTRKMHNPEWQEHCASSLREIFHEWKPGVMESEFNEFYRKPGDALTETEKEIFKQFRFHYSYFTGIDHHDASTILGSLTAILKNNSLKLKDCYENDVFIDRVKTLFQILDQIIELSRNRS